MRVADGVAGNTTVSVSGSNCSTASIAFTVVAPSAIIDTIYPGSAIAHVNATGSIGAYLAIYLEPNNVSFSNLHEYEENANIAASGYYVKFNNTPHESSPTPAPLKVGTAQSQGSLVVGHDNVQSGYDPNLVQPFVNGSETVTIPIHYVTRSGADHVFTSAIQDVELTGNTRINGATNISLIKANAIATANVNDSTTDYISTPAPTPVAAPTRLPSPTPTYASSFPPVKPT